MESMGQRVEFLEKRFAHMKACLEQKEEEVLQLKHETKRLKTARAYE